MLPGSLYYHFAAKEDLLVAVYEEGVRLITERCAAIAGMRNLAEAGGGGRGASGALLKTGDYALVVIRCCRRMLPARLRAW